MKLYVCWILISVASASSNRGSSIADVLKDFSPRRRGESTEEFFSSREQHTPGGRSNSSVSFKAYDENEKQNRDLDDLEDIRPLDSSHIPASLLHQLQAREHGMKAAIGATPQAPVIKAPGELPALERVTPVRRNVFDFQMQQAVVTYRCIRVFSPMHADLLDLNCRGLVVYSGHGHDGFAVLDTPIRFWSYRAGTAPTNTTLQHPGKRPASLSVSEVDTTGAVVYSDSTCEISIDMHERPPQRHIGRGIQRALVGQTGSEIFLVGNSGDVSVLRNRYLWRPATNLYVTLVLFAAMALILWDEHSSRTAFNLLIATLAFNLIACIAHACYYGRLVIRDVIARRPLGIHKTRSLWRSFFVDIWPCVNDHTIAEVVEGEAVIAAWASRPQFGESGVGHPQFHAAHIEFPSGHPAATQCTTGDTLILECFDSTRDLHGMHVVKRYQRGEPVLYKARTHYRTTSSDQPVVSWAVVIASVGHRYVAICRPEKTKYQISCYQLSSRSRERAPAETRDLPDGKYLEPAAY